LNTTTKPATQTTLIGPTELKATDQTRIGEYIDLALERGLITTEGSGSHAIMVLVGASHDPQKTFGLKLAYLNQSGKLFTSEAAAQNYIDLCGNLDADLKRSGGFIVKIEKIITPAR